MISLVILVCLQLFQIHGEQDDVYREMFQKLEQNDSFIIFYILKYKRSGLKTEFLDEISMVGSSLFNIKVNRTLEYMLVKKTFVV